MKKLVITLTTALLVFSLATGAWAATCPTSGGNSFGSILGNSVTASVQNGSGALSGFDLGSILGGSGATGGKTDCKLPTGVTLPSDCTDLLDSVNQYIKGSNSNNCPTAPAATPCPTPAPVSPAPVKSAETKAPVKTAETPAPTKTVEAKDPVKAEEITQAVKPEEAVKACGGKTCTTADCTAPKTDCAQQNCVLDASCVQQSCITPAVSGDLQSLFSTLLKQCGIQIDLTDIFPDCPIPTVPGDSGATPPPVTTPPAQTTPPAETTPPAQTTPPVETTTPPANNGADNLSFEEQVVTLVNQERAAYGLSPLTLNAALSDVARAKSQDMHDLGYFSHTSPTYGSPFDMMKAFGISYGAAGENIAMGYASPESVMKGWMNSEGHRANILSSSFTQIGVGYVADGSYWTQMFIG